MLTGSGIREYYDPLSNAGFCGPARFIGWTALTFTLDYATLTYTVYVNGAMSCSVQLSSAPWSASGPQVNPVLAGSFVSSPSAYFVSFRGWNVSHSAAAIAADYAAVIAQRPYVPGSAAYPACACGEECGSGVVLCMSAYGGSPVASGSVNTAAFYSAVDDALNLQAALVVFDAEPGSVYAFNLSTPTIPLYLSAGQSMTVDGNGCTALVVNSVVGIVGLLSIVGAGIGQHNTFTLQNLTLDMTHPPWAQAYYLAQPSSHTWQFEASGLIPDPDVDVIDGIGYVYQFNAALDNFVYVSGFQACDDWSFTVDTTRSPSIYTLEVGAGCPSLNPSVIDPGTPFVVAFTNNFQVATVEYLDTVVFRNVVAHQGGIGPAYCGNQTFDRVIADRSVGKWITAASSVAGIRPYGNVRITNSVFRWGPDDITDYPKSVYYVASPVSDATSPVLSANDTTLVVWGQWAQNFPIPQFSMDQFRVVSAAGDYMRDASARPYLYTMTIPSQTATYGVQPVWTYGTTSYYQFVITSPLDGAAALRALPRTAVFNWYSFQAAMPTTLYVSNCSFGPGHSHAFYADFAGGTIIEDSVFTDVEYGAITGETGSEGHRRSTCSSTTTGSCSTTTRTSSTHHDCRRST